MKEQGVGKSVGHFIHYCSRYNKFTNDKNLMLLNIKAGVDLKKKLVRVLSVLCTQ